MYPDQLYELAFAFRKTKLWKSLYDSELFAVSLPGGEIGYCSVMGFLGEHLALALYVGNRGLDSYRLLQGLGEREMNPLKAQESMLSQDCLQCSFESRDELSPQEQSSVRAYTAQHGLSLRGANAFPQFTGYLPARYPWPVSDREDMQRLCAALKAALAVSEKLKSARKSQLGFREGPAYDRSIPLLAPAGEGFSWSLHPLPPRQPVQYPEPVLKDELLMMRLRKTRKHSGTWACDVVMLPQPSAEDETAAPVFPYTLLAGDCETGIALSTIVVADYEADAEALLRALGEHMLEQGVPRQIQVVDERTYSLLKNLAAALKIKLTLQPENDLLDEMEAEFVEYFSDQMSGTVEDELEELFKMLSELDDDTLLAMPNELWSQLRTMERHGVLDEELAERLRSLPRWKK